MILEHKPTKKVKYVAECGCTPEAPFRDVRTDNPPRSKLCPKCGSWVAFHEEVENGPNLLLE